MSIIAFVRDSPLASTELHLLLDELSLGDLAASHGAMCRYMPTALLPISASANLINNNTDINQEDHTQVGAGTPTGDALMMLAFLKQSGTNQPTILDAWIGMAASSLSTTTGEDNEDAGVVERPKSAWSYNPSHRTCPVLLVTDSDHCKAVERFGAARGIPVGDILCTGRSTPTPLLAPTSPTTTIAGTPPTTPNIATEREGLGILSFLSDLGMVLREKRSQLKEPVVVLNPALLATTTGEFSTRLLPEVLVTALKTGMFGGTSPLKPPYAVMAADDNGNVLSPLVLTLTLEALDEIIAFIKKSNSTTTQPNIEGGGAIRQRESNKPTFEPPIVPAVLSHLESPFDTTPKEVIAADLLMSCLTDARVAIHSITHVIPRSACMSKVHFEDYMCATGFVEACIEATEVRYEAVIEYMIKTIHSVREYNARQDGFMSFFIDTPRLHPRGGAPSIRNKARISHRSFARVGLMGNPSDQLNGKSLAVTIQNFWAEAHIMPGVSTPMFNGVILPQLTLIPNPIFDQFTFGGLSNLSSNVSNEGYTGGMRLMQATCKRFYEYCSSHRSLAAALQSLGERGVRGGFALTYHTNIPRQVGLAGSSAIIVSILKCLLELYGIGVVYDDSGPTTTISTTDAHPQSATTAIPPTTAATMSAADVASLALSVEVLELGIHAGLMDRVAQVYGGMVAMDFSKDVMAAETDKATSELQKQQNSTIDNDTIPITTTPPGQVVAAMQRGRYERLPLSMILPTLTTTTEGGEHKGSGGGIMLAYARDPSDSGKIHANVKERWMKGDEEVLDAARSWAGFVDEALEVLRLRSSSSSPASQFLPERFCQLVDENFDLRFKVYGEECLGWKNVYMVQIARAHNAAGKFCGSGGAIIVLPRPSTDIHALQEAMGVEGFVLVQLIPTE